MNGGGAIVPFLKDIGYTMMVCFFLFKITVWWLVAGAVPELY